MEKEMTDAVVEETTTTADNSAAITDLIQSIQSKLNNENGVSTQAEPEVKEKELTSEGLQPIDHPAQSNNNFDLSKIASLLSNPAVSNILGSLSGNNNQTKENATANQETSNSGFSLGDIDPNMILKFQRIIGSMNQADPNKNLLLSLKPFLRKSRQDKIGEYITMLTIVKAIGIFGSKGSDSDVS